MAKMMLIVHSGLPAAKYRNMTAEQKQAHLLEKCVEAGYKKRKRVNGQLIDNPEKPLDWAMKKVKKQKKKVKLRVDYGRTKK